MARYIFSILRTELTIMLSWGFNSAFALPNGLSFFVNGYKHKGRVGIVYDEGWDLFTVRTINADGTVKEQQEGIYADGLVTVVDSMVEKTEDYAERVRRDYYNG